jgi:hypothetical protein
LPERGYFGFADFQFITADERSVVCDGAKALNNCPKGQNLHTMTKSCLSGRSYFVLVSADNASLVCGYANQAFQATVNSLSCTKNTTKYYYFLTHNSCNFKNMFIFVVKS